MSSSPPGSPPPRRTSQIRDALVHVGELMQLPPKRPTAAIPAPAAAEPTPAVAREARGAAFWLPVTALVFASLAGVVLLWPAASDPLPTPLLGEWTTKYSGYEGRSLAFTATEVHIGTAAGVPRTAHAIRSVDVATRGDTTMVLLTYDVEGDEVELQAGLLQTTPARLVFFRPEGLVWERGAGALRMSR